MTNAIRVISRTIDDQPYDIFFTENDKDSPNKLMPLTDFFGYAAKLMPEKDKKSFMDMINNGSYSANDVAQLIDVYFSDKSQQTDFSLGEDIYQISISDDGKFNVTSSKDKKTPSILEKYFNHCMEIKRKKPEFAVEQNLPILQKALKAKELQSLTTFEALDLFIKFWHTDDKQKVCQDAMMAKKSYIKKTQNYLERFSENSNSNNGGGGSNNGRSSLFPPNPPKVTISSKDVVENVLIDHLKEDLENDATERALYANIKKTITTKTIEYTPVTASLALRSDGSTELFVNLPSGPVAAKDFPEKFGMSYREFSLQESARWAAGYYSGPQVTESESKPVILKYQLETQTYKDNKYLLSEKYFNEVGLEKKIANMPTTFAHETSSPKNYPQPTPINKTNLYIDKDSLCIDFYNMQDVFLRTYSEKLTNEKSRNNNTSSSVLHDNAEEKNTPPITPQTDEKDLPLNQEQNDGFKASWRDFANKVKNTLGGELEEDESSNIFKAKITHKDESVTHIAASSANDVALSAQKSDGSEDIPNLKVFQELAQKAKQNNQNINFGNIRDNEFKARLLIACKEKKVKPIGEPKIDKEFLESLNPATATRLSALINKEKTMKQIVVDEMLHQASENKPQSQPTAKRSATVRIPHSR